MKKREQYKRLINFLNTVIIIGALTAVFAHTWYSNFADSDPLLLKPFFRRGNYALIALYALISVLFYRVYGATRVGYMRILESAYTQVLSVLCGNAVTYLQLCLIGNALLSPAPMAVLFLIQTVVAILLILVYTTVYHKLYCILHSKGTQKHRTR